MAEATRVIDEHIIRHSSEGAEKVVADADRVAKSEERIAKATDVTTAAQERAERRVLSKRRALEAFAAANDKAFRASRDLERAQSLIDASFAQGLAGTRAYESAVESLGKKQADYARLTAPAVAANENLGKSGQIAAHHLTNLGYQISDIGVSLAGGQSPFLVLIQQGGQIAPILGETGVMGAVKGVGNTIRNFLTPATVTMGLLTGAVILGYGAWSRYDDETRKSRVTLEGLGRGLGLTTDQFEEMATSAAKAGNMSARQATALGQALAATGTIGPENIGRLIAISKDFAATFSLSLDTVKDKLASSFGSVEGIVRLNRELNFLDAKTEAYIQSLGRQGRAQEAIRIAIEKIPSALARQEDAQGLVARAWKAITDAISDADHAAGKFLDRLTKGPAPDERLKQLQNAVKEAEEALRNAEANAASATFSQRNRSALDSIKRPGLDSLPPMEVVQDFRPAIEGQKQLKQAVQDTKNELRSYLEDQAKIKRAEEEAAQSRALEESLNKKSNQLREISKEVANGSDEWLRYRDLQQAVDGALKSGDPALMSRVDNVKNLSEASDVLRHVTESMTKADGERMTQGDRAAEQRRLDIAGVKARTTEERASLATSQAVARQRGQLMSAEQALADAQHAGQMVREQDARQLQDMLRDRMAEGAEIKQQIALVGADAETRAVAIARRRTEQEIVRDGKDVHSDAAQAVIREAEANARLGVTLDQTTEAQRRMNDAQRQLGDEASRFFEAFIVGGQKVGDVFKGLAQSIASSGLRGLLTGQGPLATMLGTAGESGQLGGLLGGKGGFLGIELSDLRKTFASGFGEGFDRTFGPLLEPTRNAAGESIGFMSSGLGKGLASAGIGASVGYSSGSPLAGALSGGLAGLMTGNPLLAVAGAGAGAAAHRCSPKGKAHVARQRVRLPPPRRDAHGQLVL